MRNTTWLLRLLVAALATTGAIVACKDNIPGPTYPIAPEVGPQGPRPKPLGPETLRVVRDGGVPLPSPLETSTPQRPAVRVAQAPPTDAGIVDVIDLPPVVDGDIRIYEDAAQPLN